MRCEVRLDRAQRLQYPLPNLCEVLDVSVSGYPRLEAWWQTRAHASDGPAGVALMKNIHAQVKAAYGSRRMPGTQGRAIASACAGRAADARERHQGAAQAALQGDDSSRHSMPVADNLLARNFTPAAPSRVWTGDITTSRPARGWLYLAIVLDLFNPARSSAGRSNRA